MRDGRTRRVVFCDHSVVMFSPANEEAFSGNFANTKGAFQMAIENPAQNLIWCDERGTMR